MTRRFTGLVSALFLITAWSFSLPASGWPDEILKQFSYRPLGPYRCGSWISAFAVPDSPQSAHLYTFYVGARNGGVWKTTNNGTTFTPIFDQANVLSIGALALAPSAPETIWVGTGESYCARLSTAGDGVYKSPDGGKTWQHLGLNDTQHISRIVIHPANPEIVYAAAMGHLFTPNAERGVFKTEDGGKNWKKVFYLDPRVVVIDLIIDPRRPDTLYAASYEKERRPWRYDEAGPGSGIHKTTDGGRTWTRLAGGLPNGRIGRIGLDIFPANPDILYALVENGNSRPSTLEELERDRRNGGRPIQRSIGDEVYRSDDGGRSWQKMTNGREGLGGKAAYSFNQLRVDPKNDLNIYITGVTLASSIDGGRTWHDVDWPATRLFAKAFGDVRTFWIDPQNPDRMLLGSDGGVHLSYDGGKTCDHFTNLPLGEFYAIGLDQADPYNIYGGLQDHDSWKGPSNGWTGEITIEDWITVGGQDGMYNQIDPEQGRYVYNTFQLGGQRRLDQQLGTIAVIEPRPDPGRPPYRFNWVTPLVMSPHNSSTIYTGAQFLLRSLDRGDHWQEISPDLTSNDRIKTMSGPGMIPFCTLTTISESPVKPGVIWVGSDDGRVQVTRDGGASWTDRTPALTAAGAPETHWVSRVLAAPHDPATAYVCKNGFREDDPRPYVFRTTDFGRTWKSITTGLPSKAVNVIIADRRRAGLLFLGNDHGVYLSDDSGDSWQSFRNDMPPVKVTDLAIHPRENDLVVATYGRGLYITDISVLQHLEPRLLEQQLVLLTPRPGTPRLYGPIGNYRLYGNRYLVSPNDPEGTVIHYFLKDSAAVAGTVVITAPEGQTIRQLPISGKAGLHSVPWDLRPDPTPGRPPWEASTVKAGNYRVTIAIGELTQSAQLQVKPAISWSYGPFPIKPDTSR
jgi:photosystem II stability/assembly factor-like uncharacterized protein